MVFEFAMPSYEKVSSDESGSWLVAGLLFIPKAKAWQQHLLLKNRELLLDRNKKAVLPRKDNVLVSRKELETQKQRFLLDCAK